jgi:hypothetical protein
MKLLTWADFKQHKPCYPPAEKYGQWSGTILDLMQHPDIPDVDKIWAFTRQGIADDRTLRLFAVKCAREVQHPLTDERIIAALDVAERYANGEATDEELKAAVVVGMAAEVAWAVRVDMMVLHWMRRWAAWDAAWEAARASARDVARVKQVQIAIELLK